MTRVSWAKTWMSVAETIAENRSYDPRLKVGAIVVSQDNTQILSVGFNGNHKGGPHEHESDVPGESGFIHAEINSLLKLDYNNPKKKTMYVTISPCRACAKAIVNSNIDRVIYGRQYRDPSGIELLRSAGVEVCHIDDVEE